jgi:histidinol-phosphate/aromatic aminotransferase/cobyric acid decarboxylase-like protein
MHCNQCIRVTIGTPSENKKFFDILKSTWSEMTTKKRKAGEE